MGNLFGSLVASAGSLRAVERSLAAVQNNVANAGAPGYAKQTQVLLSRRFNPGEGLPGGVDPGVAVSARSEFAEETVRGQNSSWGRASQQVNDLANVEPVFTISEGSGISGALTNLYQSFSQLSISPNDSSARLVVIERARSLARSFNSAAKDLGSASLGADRESAALVGQINTGIADLKAINHEIRASFSAKQDAGLDARLHATLENLAEVASIKAIPQEDGTFSVFLAGQVPLLVGENQYSLRAVPTGAQTQVIDGRGIDVAGLVTEGRLSASLETKNTTIPSLTSSLDALAKGFADQVNGVLGGGVDAAGNAPTKTLFTYSATGSPAGSLAVSNIAPPELAAALPSAPGGNGNALNLGALAGAKAINGFTFTEYYGNVAAQIGRQLSAARTGESSSKQLLAQARSARQDISGVNLDEEAARLIELQRGYQASAKMLTVLNELTDTVINILR